MSCILEKRAKRGLKLDVSKAYDRVEWGFLKGMIRVVHGSVRVGFVPNPELTRRNRVLENLTHC